MYIQVGSFVYARRETEINSRQGEKNWTKNIYWPNTGCVYLLGSQYVTTSTKPILHHILEHINANILSLLLPILVKQ